MTGSTRLFDPRRGFVPHPDPADRFREEVMPHMDAAYNYARYLTRDPVSAEDVVQDAFLRAFRAISGYRGGAGKAWLLAIVRNCFLDRIGADRGQRLTPDESSDEPVAALDDPEAALMAQNTVAAVRSAVARLPDPFRETLVLREFEDLPYKEIASLTGAPIGTVMSRLARARQMLAELLLLHSAESRS